MTSLRQRPLHTTIARVAVAGAASLATVLASAPAAVADPVDDLAPADTSSDTASDDVEPEVAPTDETPTEDQPDSDEAAVDEQAPAESEAPAPTAKADTADDEDADVLAAEVEPQYGLQKFRVGVKFAPGAATDGQTTAGSTFRVQISPSTDEGIFEPFEGADFTCTTFEPAEPDPEGTTYCQVDEGDESEGEFRIEQLARASSGSVVPESDLPVEQAFSAPPGSTVTVTQLTAAEGFDTTTEPLVIEPCTNLAGAPIPVCGSGDIFEGDLSLESSTALFVNDLTPDPAPVAEEPEPVVDDADLTAVTPTNAALPDTGGADARLLGLAGLLVASGSALAVGARRRRDVLVP